MIDGFYSWISKMLHQLFSSSLLFSPFTWLFIPFFQSSKEGKIKRGHSIILHTSPHQAILIPDNWLILHRSLLARTSRKTLNHGIAFGRDKVRNGITRWRHTIYVSIRRRRGRADAVKSRFQNVVAPSLH